MLSSTDEIFKCKKHNTSRQSWLYLDNNGTMTYRMIIQHNMHTTSTNNITIIKQSGLAGSSPCVSL